MSKTWPLSTILVTGSALRDRDTFVVGLQHQGYVVLEAHSETEAVEIARLHSRPIHIMLIDGDVCGRSLSAKLSRYRTSMTTLFINWSTTENEHDTLAPHLVPRKIREILEPGRADLKLHAGAA